MKTFKKFLEKNEGYCKGCLDLIIGKKELGEWTWNYFIKRNLYFPIAIQETTKEIYSFYERDDFHLSFKIAVGCLGKKEIKKRLNKILKEEKDK